MFSKLTNSLASIFQKFRGRISINEVNKAIEEIYDILIEGDLALEVVESITYDLKEYVNTKELNKISSADFLIERMHKILIKHLDNENNGLFKNLHNNKIIMIGLQGSGKTTMCGKISYKMPSTLVSLDTSRPAAREQLKLVAQRVNTKFLSDGNTPYEIAQNALMTLQARENMIFDTAGRYDDESIAELHSLIELIKPNEIVFVADAMSGQSILNVINQFSSINITRIAFSRVDADARGGAILSAVYMLKKPILLLGEGEKPEDSIEMNAKRIADRILDKGDIVALVEKAEKEFENIQTKGIQDITLQDFIIYLDKIKSMGGLAKVISYLPGFTKLKNMIPQENDKDIIKMKAIICSMTKRERLNPFILNRSRKERISKGSGTNVKDVENLVQVFSKSKQMISQFIR